MGDDWPDLPLLARAAFACAPPDAHVEVRALASTTSPPRAGGHGAARECCDLLLIATGRYAELLRGPLHTLDATSLTEGAADVPPAARPLTASTSASPAREPRRRQPWHARLLDLGLGVPAAGADGAAGASAPGGWSQAPAGRAPPAPAPPRHEPDYTMTRFMVQRFGADGALRTQIEGDAAAPLSRHDTLEIDNARIRAVARRRPRHAAPPRRRALANGDGSEVQLLGDAQVVRGRHDKEEAIDFRGEFLHAFRNIERVRSHLPVT